MKRIGLCTLLLLLLPCLCHAAKTGLFSAQVMSGYVVSPVIKPRRRPDLNYMMLDARIEWLRLNRNFSSYMELTYSKTTKGARGYMAGFTFLVRYNFNHSTSLNPYLQFGAGLLYNDIYKDRSQDLIGNNIEFNPQLSIGISHRISSHIFLDTEAIFHHVSNAGLKRGRNVGVNGIGLLVGITYAF